ncbi:MAG: N-acetyl-beta-hexosaminidase [Mongoliibacter sp.]|uniref:family 20 glycosylhydrolase n=1 Tax=Mongoliibacter sp. TaxID=2022438 RepID=UPI0012F13F87|nr:family 20 glycosylhydrolase [Mongoliibacter sp.]TVP51877.1 MAG: N-acetyl-beta-hexosaminidase [Mongoliibacter sp.]
MKRQLLYPALLVFVVSFLISSCFSEKKQFAVDDLQVEWQILENTIQPEQFHKASFTLTNKSQQNLKADWEIYFNSVFLSVNPEISDDKVVMEHLSGDFFRIKPSEDFPILSPGEHFSFEYSSGNFLTKNSHIPEALYIVFGNNPDQGFPLNNYHKKGLNIPSLAKIAKGTSLPIPTGNHLFEENKNLSTLNSREFSPIIPTPKKYEWGDGDWEKSAQISFYVAEDFEAQETHLKKLLGGIFEGSISSVSKEEADIRIVKSSLDLGKEGYELKINDQVIIEASEAPGVFYGIQSLMALFPVDIFSEKVSELSLPRITVKDEPRFEYRGLFLDVARNFQSKSAVLKLLDLMAFYKLNVFHFNLANDEGWRIEIPGLPELTDIGSKRGHSREEKDFLWPYYGSGPDKNDSPSGTGYYSTADFKEILQYAQERHIEVIPEIGVPAHSRAAIIAMRARYHQKMEEGDEEGAKEYLLEDFDDQSEYLSAQNFRGNTICICQESAFGFYEKVVDEIAAMYDQAGITLQTFHTGGDEVPHGAWTASPICEKFIQQSEQINTVDDLRNYFYQKISKMFAERNIQVAGWEEIGQIEVSEKGEKVARPNPEFANAGFRVHAWNAVAGWGGEDMAYQLANEGYEVIVSNSSNVYFDLAYDLHPDEPGHLWSGHVNLQTSWQMVPLNHFISNDTDMYGRPIDIDGLLRNKVRLSNEGKKNIKGISGQLWTETVKGQDMMEYYLLPKMLGLVERAWAGDPDWSTISDHESRRVAREEDWNKFANAVGQRELPRLDFLFGGFNTRLPKPGTFVKDGLMHANVETPGLIIRYTRDGTRVTSSSPQYSAPVPIEGKVMLRVFTPSGKGGGMSACDKWDGS